MLCTGTQCMVYRYTIVRMADLVLCTGTQFGVPVHQVQSGVFGARLVQLCEGFLVKTHGGYFGMLYSNPSQYIAYLPLLFCSCD